MWGHIHLKLQEYDIWKPTAKALVPQVGRVGKCCSCGDPECEAAKK